MRIMLWLILLQFFVGTLNAQYKEFPKLEKLFNSEKYDKCISKAEKYAKKNKKELVPYAYILKSWLKISEDPNHEDNKRAINKALSAARKIKRKDKELVLYDKFSDDFLELQLKAFVKANEEVADNKCSKAIRIYDNIHEVYEDDLSAYKKSLCLLESDFQKKEGFILLRNTMLRTYSNFKKGKFYENIPAGFASLSREYLNRNYLYNAEAELKKGVEVFPNDTSIRSEAIKQITVKYNANIHSDYSKDLKKLRDKLVWLDSSFKNYPTAVSMLKETDRRIILQHIKYEQSSIKKASAFINSLLKNYPNYYTKDSINQYLTSLYTNRDIKRISGAADNLTQLLVQLNAATSDGTNRTPTQFVFDYIIKNKDYKVAASFITQANRLYPQYRKSLAAMQQSLEVMLVQELTNSPKDEQSIVIAEEYSAIAPKNNKLAQLKKQLYIAVLTQYANDSNYSALFPLVRKAFNSYPNDKTIRTIKKVAVIADFKKNFTPNHTLGAPKMEVLSFVNSCLAGKVSDLANTKFINVLNYLRRQAGVYDSCFLDDELEEMAQDAALMMKAANKLSHSPDEKWKCYTKKGELAAKSSNLSLGHGGTSALLGQMRDDGAGNGSVGHRRWILNPYNNVFGYGSNDNAMALWVFGKRYKNNPEKNKRPNWDNEQFISWPPQDFAPLTLVPQRWSFSLASADFGNAKISVTKSGRSVNIKPEKVQNGYAINTCAWQMKDAIKAGDVYKITIKNVKVLGSNKPQSFTYTVEVLDL